MNSNSVRVSKFDILFINYERFSVWPTTKEVNDAETILLYFDPQGVSRAHHEGEAQNVAVLHPA